MMRNMIPDWWGRRARAQMRRQLRTHRAILHATIDLENHRLAGLLEDAGPPVSQDALSFLPEKYRNAGMTCLQQRCLTMNFSFLLVEVSKHLIAPGTPLVMPIPKRWREHLRRQGLSISAKSQLRFALVVLDALVAGLRAVRLLILLRRRGQQVVPPAAKYHVFVDVNAGHLPDPSEREERRNLHSWYQAYYGLEKDFAFVAENCGVDAPQWYAKTGVLVAQHFPPLDAARHRKFIRVAIRRAVGAVAWTLLGRWWHAVLLLDAVKLAYFQLLPTDALAHRYLFHAGNCLVRPLWTYDAEARGASVVNAFYSGNFITFTPNPSISPARTLALSTMSWPEMVCLDKESRDALVAYGLPPKTIQVSDIPFDFYDDGPPLPSIGGPVVMLFDVTPYRSYFKASRGFHNAYYTTETWTRFIDDIVQSAKRHGWTVALKTKRKKNRFNAPAYQRYVERLAMDPGVVLLDAGIGTSRAITIADAVISMPFTSPSLIATRQGCPGAFYDPGGKLSHCHALTRGMPMLTTSSELDDWFFSLSYKARNTKPSSTRTLQA